jgi:hypothetical protein
VRPSILGISPKRFDDSAATSSHHKSLAETIPAITVSTCSLLRLARQYKAEGKRIVVARSMSLNMIRNAFGLKPRVVFFAWRFPQIVTSLQQGRFYM